MDGGRFKQTVRESDASSGTDSMEKDVFHSSLSAKTWVGHFPRTSQNQLGFQKNTKCAKSLHEKIIIPAFTGIV